MPRHRWPIGLAVLCLCLNGLSCVESPAEPESSRSQVVAKVGDREITLDELDERSIAADIKPYQQLYEARRRVLNGIVEDQLLENEAQKRGTTTEQLTAEEIDGTIAPVTDAEIEDFYNQNKARIGNRTLDSVRTQITQFLGQQRAQEARKVFFDQLKEQADITLRLDPPRVPVTVDADDPAVGPADAPITIVEFSDFQCPYCQRVGPTIESVREAYGDKVRIVFRDYPLAFHKQAQVAAEAAQCAHEQGKFWEYHDALFANQRALNPPDLKKYAADLGLDSAEFDECVDSRRYESEVKADFQYGQTVGVSGTPAFFINGRFVSGAQPFEKFKEIIEEELQARES